RLVRAERYRLRWPPLYVLRIWWSPPGRPEFSSVRGHDRRAPPGPPRRACGALREKTPCSRYPVRHPPETGRRRIARTKSKDGKRWPGRRWSRRVWSGVPGIERDGHTDTATGAARPSEPRTSAVRLRPWPPLGAERLARPIPRLPDRSDRPYGVVQKQGRGIGLLLASLPDGSQQRFFFPPPSSRPAAARPCRVGRSLPCAPLGPGSDP